MGTYNKVNISVKEKVAIMKNNGLKIFLYPCTQVSRNSFTFYS